MNALDKRDFQAKSREKKKKEKKKVHDFVKLKQFKKVLDFYDIK